MTQLKPCCLAGSVSEGTPAGVCEKVAGVDGYWAKPEAPTTRAIVLCTDVFGYNNPNSQLIADKYAKVCKGTAHVRRSALERS